MENKVGFSRKKSKILKREVIIANTKTTIQARTVGGFYHGEMIFTKNETGLLAGMDSHQIVLLGKIKETFPNCDILLNRPIQDGPFKKFAHAKITYPAEQGNLL
jgi:hypothetical protein